MDLGSARKELDKLRVEIDAMNDRKQAALRAWEGEKERQGDPTLEPPEDLRAMNKQLAGLYGQRDDILVVRPDLAAEYGGKKRGVMKKSPLGTSPTAQANKAAKKARWLANRENKRLENRRRAQQRGSGCK